MSYTADIKVGVVGLSQVDRLGRALQGASDGIDRLQDRFKRLIAPALRPRIDTSQVERSLRGLDAAFQRVRTVRVRVEYEQGRLPGVPAQRALPGAGGTGGGGGGGGGVVLGTALGRSIGTDAMAGRMAGGMDMGQQVAKLATALTENTSAVQALPAALGNKLQQDMPKRIGGPAAAVGGITDARFLKDARTGKPAALPDATRTIDVGSRRAAEKEAIAQSFRLAEAQLRSGGPPGTRMPMSGPQPAGSFLWDRYGFGMDRRYGFPGGVVPDRTRLGYVPQQTRRSQLTPPPPPAPPPGGRGGGGGGSNLPAPGKAGGLIAEARKLAAAYIGVDQALRQVGATFTATFARENAEQRIKAVAQGLDDYRTVQLAAISSGKQFALSTTESLDSFGRLYSRLRPLGLSLKEVNDVFVGYNTAAKLSGATTAETANTLTQLAQGLGAGALRGDELRSVLEQVPAAAKAIADELNVPVGQLKKLGENGELSSDVVVRALQKVAKDGAGRLAEALDTPAVKVQRLGAAWEDLQASLGKTALPALLPLLDRLTLLVGKLQGDLERTKIAADLLVKSPLGEFFAGVAGWIGKAADQLERYVGFAKFLQENPIAATGPLGAIFAGARNKFIEVSGGGSGREKYGPPVPSRFLIPESPDKRSLRERLGVGPAEMQEAVRKGVIGGLTGGGQSDASRGRSSGPHLHSQALGGMSESQHRAFIDRALEFPGSRTASSYGLSRGHAGHGYAGLDFLTPQGTPFRLRPGYSAADMGVQGALGRGLRISGPGGAVELGHLAGVETGKLPDAWDTAEASAREAEKAAEEARNRRLKGLDQEETRVRALADLAKARAGSELEKLGIEKKLQNDLLFIAAARAKVEPDPNVAVQAAARRGELAAQEAEVLKQIAGLAQPIGGLESRFQDVFRLSADPLADEVRGITTDFADLNREVDELLNRLGELGGTNPATEALRQRLTGLKGSIASGAEAAPTIARQRLAQPLLDEGTGLQREQEARIRALGQGRTELTQQEQKMLQIKALGIDINSTEAQRVLAQAGINDGLDRQIDTLTQQLALYRSIGQTIEQGIGDAIIGLVSGTQSLNEALSQTLRQIGEILIRSAVMNGLGALGSGGGFLGRLFGGKFAQGGMPPVGRPSIVGEYGPELFVPSTSGTVVPTGAFQATAAVANGGIPLAPAAGFGSDATASEPAPLPIDYRRVGDIEVVTKADLERVRVAATKDGARQGRALVTRSMKRDPGFRAQMR